MKKRCKHCGRLTKGELNDKGFCEDCVRDSNRSTYDDRREEEYHLNTEPSNPYCEDVE